MQRRLFELRMLLTDPVVAHFLPIAVKALAEALKDGRDFEAAVKQLRAIAKEAQATVGRRQC